MSPLWSDKNSHSELDETTRIFNEHKRIHLSKLIGESLQGFLDKWIDIFFARQELYIDKDEFRMYLETVVEEYVWYFQSSSDNILSKETLTRMGQIAQSYHEMLYDGEINPYTIRNQERLVKKVWLRDRFFRILNKK